MPFNNYSNPKPFKWPWAPTPTGPSSAGAATQPAAMGSSGASSPSAAMAPSGPSSFTFPSNMAQQTQDSPGPAFSQPAQGMQRGPRQFAPSFGASSGGGSKFKNL